MRETSQNPVENHGFGPVLDRFWPDPDQNLQGNLSFAQVGDNRNFRNASVLQFSSGNFQIGNEISESVLEISWEIPTQVLKILCENSRKRCLGRKWLR